MAAGQRKVAAGQREVSEAWDLFEEACNEASLGELPVMIGNVIKAERPLVRRPRAMKREVKKEEEVQVEGKEKEKVGEEEMQAEAGPSTSGQAGVIEVEMRREDMSSPITERVEGTRKYVYRCPYCEFPTSSSKSAVECHVRREHTKEPLSCNWCVFTTYSPDYLGQHLKTHKS